MLLSLFSFCFLNSLSEKEYIYTCIHKEKPTHQSIMDHSFVHKHSKKASSVFSFMSTTASWKVKKMEEREVEEEEEEEEGAYYDDYVSGEEEGGVNCEEEEEIKMSRQAKKKRSMHLADGGSPSSTGKKVVVAVAQSPLPLRVPPVGCQVEECVADLTHSKRYHQRHKVCEYHSKAQVVIVAGLRQRFCQQCSRFHDVSEFDDAKRSCRRRLAGHNERRRKHFSDSRGESSPSAGRRGSGSGSGSGPGSVSQMDKKQCRQVDERGRTQIALSENNQNFHVL